MSSIITTLPRPVAISRPGEPLELHTRSLDHAPALQQLIAENPGHVASYGEPTARRYPALENLIYDIKYPAFPSKHYLTILIGNMAVGSLGYTPSTTRRVAEVSWWIGYRHIRQGYATRALSLLADQVFETTNTRYLRASIRQVNEPSVKTAKRVGFSPTGWRLRDFNEFELSRQVWEERLAA